MKKRILGGLIALSMTFGPFAAFAEEAATDTVPDTATETVVTEGNVDPAASQPTTEEPAPVVDVTSPDYTNLDPAKGDLIYKGMLLLDANGFRAEKLEDVVNLPEDFYTSKEYLEFIAPPEPTPEASSSFPDVMTNHANLEAIEYMKSKGYIVGYEDGTFRPDRGVTRAEFVKVLVEKDGGIASVADTEVSGFSDVDGETPHWAQKYIILGVKKGYLVGMGDGTFAPDANITYEQAIKILVCHAGKETAAKAKVSGTVPLWPNAYVITGEQMNMNVNTGLSMGMLVNRAQFAQMFHNTIKTLQSNIVPVKPSGGGGGGGGGSDDENKTYRITGVIVSTYRVSIDPDVEPSNDPAYIIVDYYNTKTAQNEYIELREPIPASGNKEGQDKYKEYLGYEVNIRYFKNDYQEKNLEIKELTTTSNTKIIEIDDDEFNRSKSTPTEIYYKNSKGNVSTPVKIPENLDDLAVIYNGVIIDAEHPSHDHDFVNDTTFVKLEDIMPKHGSVKFINRNGGEAEVAVVTSYDTIVAKAQPSGGVVTDKYNSTRTYQLDETRLLTKLNTDYQGIREPLEASDIEVTFSIKGSTSSSEVTLSRISKNYVLSVYASKDLTKINVVICNQYAGTTSATTGVQVTTSFSEDDSTVYIDKKKYVVTDYMINNVNTGKYTDVDEVSELFPLGEKVVAYLDSHGEIADVVIKDPDYVYGYLVDVDYEEGNTLADSYFNFRIITKANVTKYSNPDNQTYKVPVTTGKITVDGKMYKYKGEADNDYEKLAQVLEANANAINYGDYDTAPKPTDVIVHAKYAQPIRFVEGATTGTIKTILTMQPVLAYTKDTATYTASKAYYIGSYMLGTNATVFSVPDDRYDYDAYTVQTRSYIKAYGTYNPEVYQETTSEGTVVNNCVVLYDEGITGSPSISSKIAIVKDIEYYNIIDDEYVYTVTVYEPTSITGKSEAKYYATEDELKTTNTNLRIDVGDVIVYGKTKISDNTGTTVKTLSAIKNIKHVVDISNREKTGFNKKYNRSGVETPTDDSPYYWFRFGTVMSFDSANDSITIDVGEEEPMLIQGAGTFFSTSNSNTLSKPVYFFENEDEEPDINQATGDRFETYTLADMLQEGDMMFMYATGTTSTQKTLYLIPKYDLDLVYPEDDTNITYSTVTFKVSPENAQVTMNGTTITATAGEAVFENIPKGYYDYTVSAEGYEDYTGTHIVRKSVPTYTVPADGTEIVLKEIRVVGGARFTVMPGNAKVTLNGESNFGTGDDENEGIVAFSNLSVGTYEYTVESNGYVTETGSIEIIAEYTTPVTIELERISYNVSVNCSVFSGELPEDLSINILGSDYALTDGTAEIGGFAEGNFSYTITVDGFETVEGTVTVTAGGTNEITAVLYRIIPSVTFTGLPEGATVAFGSETHTAGADGTVVIENVKEATEYTITAELYEALTGVVIAEETEVPVTLTPVSAG